MPNLETNPLWLQTLTAFISTGLAATIFGFIFKSTFKLGSFKEKFERLVDKISNLTTDLEVLSKDVQHLVQAGNIVRTHLVSTTGLDAKLFTSQSPLQLTKKGKKILQASGFEKIYHDNQAWFLEKTKARKPKLPSEVDEISLDLVEECVLNKEFANFKEIASQNGVTVELLAKVLSIYLREELLKELEL